MNHDDLLDDVNLDRLAQAFDAGWSDDDEAARAARYDPTVRSVNGVVCGMCDRHRHSPCSRWCWE
ncbi:hypothetical protein [Mycobacterium nebraskense]|uniref:Uncharacterized protein n=1 Tax=Mycobacterium nebraskense TaxID=244292 RepID=A0A1X1ZG51_9MYCO|nr:hypothetical protein [Mycobacterium nebraskense]MBI2696156.1 hypothetical protein [Mycobacterium nebraskense]MCV7120328.1 hypothetical protein [Mycobacterium nebraskense]ORW22306.1 hypothetical protein AWC17_05190 [Mycobacterium nebraskense]